MADQESLSLEQALSRSSKSRHFLHFPEKSREHLQHEFLAEVINAAAEHNARVTRLEKGLVNQTVYSVSFPGCRPYVTAYLFFSPENLYYDPSRNAKASGRIDFFTEASPLRNILESLAQDYPRSSRRKPAKGSVPN